MTFLVVIGFKSDVLSSLRFSSLFSSVGDSSRRRGSSAVKDSTKSEESVVIDDKSSSIKGENPISESLMGRELEREINQS